MKNLTKKNRLYAACGYFFFIQLSKTRALFLLIGILLSVFRFLTDIIPARIQKSNSYQHFS